jgi:hypothetical protein
LGRHRPCLRRYLSDERRADTELGAARGERGIHSYSRPAMPPQGKYRVGSTAADLRPLERASFTPASGRSAGSIDGLLGAISGNRREMHMGNPAEHFCDQGMTNISGRQANSRVGQVDETLGKEAGPCEFKSDTIPGSVGERYRFIRSDFGAGKRAILRLRSWDCNIRAGDGAGTLLWTSRYHRGPTMYYSTSLGR